MFDCMLDPHFKMSMITIVKYNIYYNILYMVY